MKGGAPGPPGGGVKGSSSLSKAEFTAEFRKFCSDTNRESMAKEVGEDGCSRPLGPGAAAMQDHAMLASARALPKFVQGIESVPSLILHLRGLSPLGGGSSGSLTCGAWCSSMAAQRRCVERRQLQARAQMTQRGMILQGNILLPYLIYSQVDEGSHWAEVAQALTAKAGTR